MDVRIYHLYVVEYPGADSPVPPSVKATLADVSGDMVTIEMAAFRVLDRMLPACEYQIGLWVGDSRIALLDGTFPKGEAFTRLLAAVHTLIRGEA